MKCGHWGCFFWETVSVCSVLWVGSLFSFSLKWSFDAYLMSWLFFYLQVCFWYFSKNDLINHLEVSWASGGLMFFLMCEPISVKWDQNCSSKFARSRSYKAWTMETLSWLSVSKLQNSESETNKVSRFRFGFYSRFYGELSVCLCVCGRVDKGVTQLNDTHIDLLKVIQSK